MSKAAIKLIAIKNVLVFNNVSDKVQFFTKKDEKVKATMSGYDKDKGYDIKLLAANKDGKEYIRVQVNAENEFLNGVLFPTKEKRSANSPDYYGQLDARSDNGDVIVARLAAWKKTGPKAGEFLSLSITAPNAPTTEIVKAEEQAAAVIHDDDIPF